MKDKIGQRLEDGDIVAFSWNGEIIIGKLSVKGSQEDLISVSGIFPKFSGNKVVFCSNCIKINCVKDSKPQYFI